MKKITFIFAVLLSGMYAKAQSFEWARGLNGTNKIYSGVGNSIVTDVSGSVYTAGQFDGTVDFDPGSGVYNLSSVAGNKDLFVSKLDASGNFVWAKNMGASTSASVYGNSIAIDASGNIYVTGHFFGTVDFDPGIAIVNLSTITGTNDMFVIKLDSSGNLIWAKDMSSATSLSSIHSMSIGVDAFGNVYTTGLFEETVDLDPGSGIYNLISDNVSGVAYKNIFISKLDASGNFVWAKKLGGDNTWDENAGFSIAIDGSNNIYTSGRFAGTGDFDPGIGVFNLTAGVANHMFVSKLDSSGNFVWAKNIGGPGSLDWISGYYITSDPAGNVYATGNFNGTVDFDPGPGAVNLTTMVDGGAMFVLKLNDLGDFVLAKQIDVDNASGVSGTAYSIDVDVSDNIYVTGSFKGTIDFDPGAGVTNLISTQDAVFVVKVNSTGNFAWAKRMNGTGEAYGYSINVDVFNNVFIAGYLSGIVDFNPGSGVTNIVATGSVDVFICKLSQEPTGIYEYGNSNTISVYPNPSNGVFNVLVSELKESAIIEVYNSIGALVLNKQLLSGQASIDLVNEANGLYFLKVMSENKIIGAQRIMKQ